MDRVKGFVVGSKRNSQGKIIWTVRVKQNGHDFNGQKLPVASIQDDIKLAQGLNVDFMIGEMNGHDGQPAPKAVDVKLSLTTNQGRKV